MVLILGVYIGIACEVAFDFDFVCIYELLCWFFGFGSFFVIAFRLRWFVCFGYFIAIVELWFVMGLIAYFRRLFMLAAYVGGRFCWRVWDFVFLLFWIWYFCLGCLAAYR